MEKRKVTNWGIIVLTILLALNLVVTLTGDPKTTYAAKTVSYQCVQVPMAGSSQYPNIINDYLIKMGKDGYEFIQYVPDLRLLIFKK